MNGSVRDRHCQLESCKDNVRPSPRMQYLLLVCAQYASERCNNMLEYDEDMGSRSFGAGLSIVYQTVCDLLIGKKIPHIFVVEDEIQERFRRGEKFEYGGRDEYNYYCEHGGDLDNALEALVQDVQMGLEGGGLKRETEEDEFKALPVCEKHDVDFDGLWSALVD